MSKSRKMVIAGYKAQITRLKNENARLHDVIDSIDGICAESDPKMVIAGYKAQATRLRRENQRLRKREVNE